MFESVASHDRHEKLIISKINDLEGAIIPAIKKEIELISQMQTAIQSYQQLALIAQKTTEMIKRDITEVKNKEINNTALLEF